jgi:hypothetical protein
MVVKTRIRRSLIPTGIKLMIAKMKIAPKVAIIQMLILSQSKT